MHIRFKRGCWYVERDGGHNVVPIYRNKASAVGAAEAVARREGVEVVLHARVKRARTSVPKAARSEEPPALV